MKWKKHEKATNSFSPPGLKPQGHVFGERTAQDPHVVASDERVDFGCRLGQV